ncbi:MAG: peroxidase-related enzyme [Rhizobacter sp.]|nr:peroxidase-related enzyme [Ferruginibacter sp.]
MPYINIEAHLPGVTGLLEFRKDTSGPLRELTQILLRGHSTLSEAERELIATVVSSKNECVYCTTSHTAAADAYLGENETSKKVKENIETAPVTDKMKALLNIALLVGGNGKNVSPEAIQKAKDNNASDMEIHDTVMIAALFCFYNRYVDGLGTYAPTDPVYYSDMALRLKEKGYYRPKDGYEELKNKQL